MGMLAVRETVTAGRRHGHVWTQVRTSLRRVRGCHADGRGVPSTPKSTSSWHGMAGKRSERSDGRLVRLAVPFNGCGRVGVLFDVMPDQAEIGSHCRVRWEMPRFFCCCRVLFSFKYGRTCAANVHVHVCKSVGRAMWKSFTLSKSRETEDYIVLYALVFSSSISSFLLLSVIDPVTLTFPCRRRAIIPVHLAVPI